MIRPVRPTDAGTICDIYNHFVEHTIVTFDEAPLTADTFRQYINAASDRHPWFVYEQEGDVIGYALASAWKSRCAYRYSVETTIYLAPGQAGQGLGTTLYRHLIDALSQTESHSLIAGISLPNPASIALHEKLGFEKIGQFKEVGRKFDQWIDVGYWELVFAGRH